ncbi:septum formation family protein [Lysobacter korlensis]|uniref:Septum formation family protein n=1 Tax=Lysobacter korlensis TaxID=553636 RepID=A0ABV6RWE8_9GAMM
MRRTPIVSRCAVPVAGAAVCLSLAGCTPPVASAPSPTPTESPGAPVPADPFSLRVGDCIDDDLAGEVLQVPVVDCELEHTAEAYHSERLPDGEYPGLEEVKHTAVDVCLDRFEPFAGIDYDESQHLDFAWYYPTEGSWSTGDREVLCLIMRMDPSTGQTVPTRGTLRGFAQ